MEPESSFPFLQQPTTCPNPQPDQSSPRPTSTYLKIHLNIIIPSTPVSSRLSLSSSYEYEHDVVAINYGEICV
jgi:hypothetical protein